MVADRRYRNTRRRLIAARSSLVLQAEQLLSTMRTPGAAEAKMEV